MAAQAIGNPTADSPRKYADAGGPANSVNNLAARKVPQPDGTLHEEAGNYVEPLQLQVVCFSTFWGTDGARQLPLIGAADIGEVDSALSSKTTTTTHFPKSQGQTVAPNSPFGTGFKRNSLLRKACGIRFGRKAGKRGGLNNGFVNKLLDTYLVRAEPRGAITWYELAHDRLVALPLSTGVR